MSISIYSIVLCGCASEVKPINLASYKPSQHVIVDKAELLNPNISLDLSENEANTMKTVKSLEGPKKSKPIMNHMIHESSVAVVGDMMFHNTQLFRAYNYETKSFDFSGIFKYMEPYLKANDLTFGNLETTLHGPYGSETSASDNNFYGYSGYPEFNTPDAVLEPILSAGFDFLSTANNHSLDKRYNGMIRTIEQLDIAGIKHTGTFLSINERKPFELVETNGITFAVVNYTYATNGIYLSEENMKLINTLDLYQEENIENLYRDIEAAKMSEADFVICMMHYGNEYWKVEDNRYQKPLTLEVIKRGADIVFGGHPHTLEPIDIIYQVDDLVFDQPKVIIYSLGNFIASQRNISNYNAPTDLGVMFNVYFETIDQRNPKITGIGFLPTYTIWQSDVIATMPVTEDLSLLSDNNLDINDYTYSSWDKSRIEEAEKYVVDHLMQYVYSKEIVGEVYNDKGIYRFDILD